MLRLPRWRDSTPTPSAWLRQPASADSRRHSGDFFGGYDSCPSGRVDSTCWLHTIQQAGGTRRRHPRPGSASLPATRLDVPAVGVLRHRLVDRQRLASSQQCEGCAAPPAGQCAAATAPAVARRASRWPVSVTGICVAPPACLSDFGATGHRSSHSDADGTGSDSACQQAGAPLLSRSPGTSHRAAEHLGDWPGTFTMRASVRPRRAPTKARGARGEAPGAPHQSQGASTWSPTQISILVLRADDATYAWSTTRPPLRHRPLPGRRPPRAG